MASANDPARFTHPGGAVEPARAAELSPDGLAKLEPGQSSEQLLDSLVAAGLLEDAIKFFARALPRREAVWWACRCAAEAPRPPAEGPPSAEMGRQFEAAVAAETAARTAAEGWCSAPIDDRRRAAFDAVQPAADSPSGLAALAAFLAEGSMAPANCPAVPPPPDGCANAVATAVLLSAVRSEPELADEKRARFLETARMVNASTDRWPDTPPPSTSKTTSVPLGPVNPLPPKPPPPPPTRRGYY